MDFVERMQPMPICVMGDFMLDVYTLGLVQRISPEAPVPILHVKHEKHLPGGVGNTILNLVSLGMQVIPVGRVGQDESGNVLLKMLGDENVTTRWITVDPAFQTPVKNRMIAGNQQIVRIDYEMPKPLSQDQEDQIIQQLRGILKEVRIVAISDYAKGFLTSSLLERVFSLTKSMGIPVIVDPKGCDFNRYNGASILKPNLSEAIAAARLPQDATLDAIGQHILDTIDIQSLVITKAQDGIALYDRSGKRQNFACTEQEVRDVTGAGDTVLAVMAAFLANGFAMEEAIELANIAAGLAIQRMGCARISLAELSERLLAILKKVPAA